VDHHDRRADRTARHAGRRSRDPAVTAVGRHGNFTAATTRTGAGR